MASENTETNNIMNKKINQKKECQYNYPNCQKTATHQHIVKLGSVKIDKGWICGNCKEYIKKQRNQPK